MSTPILEVRNLKTYFHTDQGIARAVDDVSFEVAPGETLAVVGESGCGKSVTALSILRLIPTPPGRVHGGQILFDGRDLLKLTEAEMRQVRGNDISMIFQEPMTALNPVFKIGRQIGAVLKLHRGLGTAQAREAAIELLREVGIPKPEKRVDEYPHQFSGGMLQRAMIAMALACDPRVLLADEPTTALDVTVQAQILELLRSLQQKRNMAVVLITHDLGVVAETADRVVVMYAGRKVEQAPVAELFRDPKHPYTRGLFASLPERGAGKAALHTIRGSVPAATMFPKGCRFHPRCPYCVDGLSNEEDPPLLQVGKGHLAACWLYDSDQMSTRGLPPGIPDEAEAGAYGC